MYLPVTELQMQASKLWDRRLPPPVDCVVLFVAIGAFSYVVANTLRSLRTRWKVDREENSVPIYEDEDGVASDDPVGQRRISSSIWISVVATIVGFAAAIVNGSRQVSTSLGSQQSLIELGIDITAWVRAAFISCL